MFLFPGKTSPEATVFARSIRPNNEIVRRSVAPSPLLPVIGLDEFCAPERLGVGDSDRNYDNWDDVINQMVQTRELSGDEERGVWGLDAENFSPAVPRCTVRWIGF
jgi:hypothetical protein